VVEPGRGVVGGGFAANTEGRNGALCNDGADFAGAGGDTMGGRAVARREALARYDEGGGVGTPWELLVLGSKGISHVSEAYS
jgi:hypothetical protein